ncbi:flagellar hook-length control protein [Mycolicibacterium arenosum]|uniref:Flagellar hook-length control protein n=1 Tax=Mycolicibacterium arenosum TaxID=2952157 RepID=A0ABT1LW55_9MYCO|nr:flagellar hook-length control protein [Mycolicibacterium sp. CAU 1645]MCP9271136.1 flagellar hook-length control protein [Mycolicibacterium sp. CAU 1645]
MTTVTPEDTIKAASSIARDVAEGALSPTALQDQAVAELREMVGTVVGPDDPAWSLQCDIARQVLALDGVPADELAEWLAVARQRAGEAVSTPAPADTPPDPVPLVSVAHDPETVPSDDADDAAVPDIADEPAVVAVVHPVPTSPRPDHYDPTAAWLAGNTRRD